MTIKFQCEQCFALHNDVDACRKCKHELTARLATRANVIHADLPFAMRLAMTKALAMFARACFEEQLK